MRSPRDSKGAAPWGLGDWGSGIQGFRVSGFRTSTYRVWGVGLQDCRAVGFWGVWDLGGLGFRHRIRAVEFTIVEGRIWAV